MPTCRATWGDVVTTTMAHGGRYLDKARTGKDVLVATTSSRACMSRAALTAEEQTAWDSRMGVQQQGAGDQAVGETGYRGGDVDHLLHRTSVIHTDTHTRTLVAIEPGPVANCIRAGYLQTFSLPDLLSDGHKAGTAT